LKCAQTTIFIPTPEVYINQPISFGGKKEKGKRKRGKCKRKRRNRERKRGKRG
jgi:hypothetical protein